MLTTTARDGRRLAWQEYGDPDGKPLVLLHGTPGGRLTAAARTDLVADLGLRLIAPDRAGYGGSDPSPGRTVLTQAADVVDVLDAANASSAYLVGGSGGGPHALAVGVAAPDRVRAVGVLVGAVPLRPEELAGQVAFNRGAFAALEDDVALRAHLEESRRVLLGDGVEALLADAPESDRAARAAGGAAMAEALADALAPGVQGMVDDFRALWREPWGFEPEDVVVPVVWGHGTADVNVPYAAARRVVDRLPQCELLTWEGVGHAPTDGLVRALLLAVLQR